MKVMAKMHIAIDMDDVVVEFFSSVIAKINHEFDLDIEYNAAASWDDNALKNLENPTWLEWLQANPGLWASFAPVRGALGALHKLRAAGHYLEIITAKEAWAEREVWDWLARYRPAVQQVTIVPVGADKVEATDALLLVDDSWHNVIPWLKSGRSAFLFDRPWNQVFPVSFPGASRLWRCTTWRDIAARVQMMS